MDFKQFYIETGAVSDKGNGHDYVNSFYSNEFTPKQYEKLNIVEIGVNKGDSIILFRDWFVNSNITGIDNKSEMNEHYTNIVDSIQNVNIIYADAYDNETCNLFEDESIDYLIDDGPHSLDSQLKCVQQWFSKIKKGGKLIIEDIQNFDTDKIKFDELGIPYEVIDTRISNQRRDDVLLIFKK